MSEERSITDRTGRESSTASTGPQALILDFAPAVAYDSGGALPVSVTVADVNGDGKPDLVVADQCAVYSDCLAGTGNGVLGVLLGKGDGTFQAATTYSSGGYQSLSAAVADVNGDGKLDIVVANQCVTGSGCGLGSLGNVGVLLGNGDGTFQPAVAYSAGYNVVSIAVADVNGDGKPDLIVANECPSSDGVSCTNSYGLVGVLLGNGDGTFQAPITYSSGGEVASSVAVADVNGDGKLDIVVANSKSGGVSVLLGNGDGTFQAAMGYNAGIQPAYLVITDVNGDNKQDIVVSNPALGVLLGNGDGTFQSMVTYTYSASGLAVGDVNGDGKPDLVAANTSANNVGVLLGNGDGTFGSAINYGSGGTSPYWVAVGDLNGDGKADLVVTNYNCSSGNCGNGTVGVLLNTSTNEALVTLSPNSLNFGTQVVPTTSSPQSVTMTNTGNIALAITSIGVTGASSSEFSQTNNCPASLSANGKCTINVTFTPTASGSASAALSIADNAPGSPQSVSLTGTGDAAVVSLSPSSVTFAGQYVGTSGLPQTVTVTNTGTAALTISNVSTSIKDFGTLSNCTNTVQPGTNCTIGVFFDPTASGSRTGSLIITDNVTGSPQTVMLTGTGQDFSMAPSGSSTVTVSPGQTANYKLSVAPGGGFNQTVAFTCSGAPSQSTCAVSPSSIALGGSSAASVDVTLTTAGTSAGLLYPDGLPPASNRLALWLALSGLSGLVVLGSSGNRHRRWHRGLLYGLALVSLFSLGVTLSACGSGSSSGTGSGGTPAGTYTVTVTGTFSSGATTLNHNTKLTLVVQ